VKFSLEQLTLLLLHLFGFQFIEVIKRPTAFVRTWIPERAAETIPQSEVLAVVARVEQMVIRVVRCAIDYWLQQSRYLEVAVVDRHRPDVDSHVQRQVQHLVQREHEHVDVIRYALHETIDGVKRMAGVRRRHFPRMMRLVYGRIDQTMMKTTMNPVDEAVCEEDEGKHRQYDPQPTCCTQHPRYSHTIYYTLRITITINKLQKYNLELIF